jgi:hypothetical protein
MPQQANQLSRPPLPPGYEDVDAGSASKPPLPPGYYDVDAVQQAPPSPDESLWGKTKRLAGDVKDWGAEQLKSSQFLHGPLEGADPNASLKEQVMQSMKPSAPLPQQVIRSAEMAGAPQAGASYLKTLPTLQKTGRLFQDVEEAGKAAGAGVGPAESLKAVATRMQELKDAGHGGGVAVNKAIRLFSGDEPITFQKARDVYSALSNLSAKEAASISGRMPHQIRELTKALGEELQKGAEGFGKGQEYAKAVRDYPVAKNIAGMKQGVINTAKDIPRTIGRGS